MKYKQFVVAIAVTGALVAFWPAQAAQAPCGACDPTFDGDGLAFGLSRGFVVEAVVQPDGKTLLLVQRDAIDGSLAVAVERLHEDGRSEMLGFGNVGVAELNFHQDSQEEYASAMMLAPDLAAVEGDFDIVVSGFARVASTSTSTNKKGKKPPRNSLTDHIVVARLNSDGTMETGFGTDGVLVLDAGSSQSGDHGMAVDSQGRILVSGRFNSDFEGTVFRVDPHGTGRYIFPDTVVLPGSIAVVSSDYVVGQTGNSGVVRWKDDGTLDSGFGTNGQIDVQGIRTHMAVDTDGSVVVASVIETVSGKGRNRVTSDKVVVNRYDSDGILVPSPGFDEYERGFAASAHLYDLKIDPEGRVVAVVRSRDETGNNLLFKGVARWNADGEMELFPHTFVDVNDWSVAFGQNNAGAGVMVLGGSRYSNNFETLEPAAIRMFR